MCEKPLGCKPPRSLARCGEDDGQGARPPGQLFARPLLRNDVGLTSFVPRGLRPDPPGVRMGPPEATEAQPPRNTSELPAPGPIGRNSPLIETGETTVIFFVFAFLVQNPPL